MACLQLTPAPAMASDHADGAAVLTDPSTDLGDVYAWMEPSGTALNLAMTVYPGAARAAQFSDQAYYIFHVTSRRSPLVTATHQVDITCSFDNHTPQNISCWIGDSNHFIYGNASRSTVILTDASGAIMVFAGPRQDPFSFNQDGWNHARSIIKQNAAALALNANGCMTGPAATVTQAQKALAADPSGNSPPTDAFAASNVLALVMKVPLSLLTQGGPIVGVSAATYRKG
jgi:hypothetical protein